MQFQVPQFIEYETKIIGPLTLKQFMFLAITCAFLLAVYFLELLSLSKFLILAIIIGGATFFLVFWKVDGRPMLTVFKNLLLFTGSNKLYLWKRKKTFASFKPLERKKTENLKTEKEKDELPLKIAGTSQLKKIRKQLEIS
ncbi:PrgI family protein [Candidatus Parcubacteria bacterium]|nr:PrgI family protein [Candidatus Parcubacteria bacterium]